MPLQHWSETIWVAQFQDEPALSEELSSLLDEVAAVDRAPDLVVDFSAVPAVNSSNLSQLLKLRKLMIDREAVLRLAAMRDSVWAVFLTTGLDKVFEFAPDVSTALALIQMQRTPAEDDGLSDEDGGAGAPA